MINRPLEKCSSLVSIWLTIVQKLSALSNTVISKKATENQPSQVPEFDMKKYLATCYKVFN